MTFPRKSPLIRKLKLFRFRTHNQIMKRNYERSKIKFAAVKIKRIVSRLMLPPFDEQDSSNKKNYKKMAIKAQVFFDDNNNVNYSLIRVFSSFPFNLLRTRNSQRCSSIFFSSAVLTRTKNVRGNCARNSWFVQYTFVRYRGLYSPSILHC